MPSGCESCPRCGQETLQPSRNRAYCLRVADCGYSERREPERRAQVAHLEADNAVLVERLRPHECFNCKEYGPPDTTLDGRPAHHTIPGGVSSCLFELDRILQGGE